MLNCTDETIDMEFNNFDLARFCFCGLHSLAGAGLYLRNSNSKSKS